MKQAAVVFTGGPSLFDARRHLHPSVHCIPSSVDASHYNPDALVAESAAAQAVAQLQGHLGSPRLGYFGVIDERLDLGLVDRLAAHNPAWQVVMVGPVVKIDPASLPQRHNLHWLGMQAYERLPYFCAGWDVCLMPFAQNEATRFISPTKTLEYMAAGKPVVSTPIKDVITLYGGAVKVAYTPEAFIQACESLLNASEQERLARAQEMASLVATSSWDRSANSVHALMSASREAALSAQDTRAASLQAQTQPALDEPRYAVGASRQ